MASYDPDANVTLNTSHTEEEWYRAGVAAQERLRALQQSLIIIPEALSNVVRVRHSTEETMVVRVVRGASRAQATVH